MSKIGIGISPQYKATTASPLVAGDTGPFRRILPMAAGTLTMKDEQGVSVTGPVMSGVAMDMVMTEITSANFAYWIWK